MLGQNSKYSSCDKPKETAVIECSSCEQWLPHCCAGMSAGDDGVEFESVPFYCSQRLSIDKQQASSSQDQCYHCHSQTGSRRKKTIQCLQCNWSFHLSCVKITRKHAKALPRWYCNTCDPVLNPPHPWKKTTMSTPLIDPISFGTYIQSLRSVDHPIHRIPKVAHPSFAARLSKLTNKAISSSSPLDWHCLVCFPLSVLSSGPWSQGVFLTSSIISRIKRIPWIRWPACPWSFFKTSNPTTKQTPQWPSQKHEKTGKPETILTSISKAPFKLYLVIAHLLTPMKNLSTPFNRNTPKPLMTLSYPHPPPPDANTPPICFSTAHIHAAISSFPHGSGAGPEGLWPQHLKDCIPITAGDASTSLLTSLTKLVNYLAYGHPPTDLRPFLYGGQRPQTHCCRMHLSTSGRQSLLETLHPKAPWALPALPSRGRHALGVWCCSPRHLLLHGPTSQWKSYP